MVAFHVCNRAGASCITGMSVVALAVFTQCVHHNHGGALLHQCLHQITSFCALCHKTTLLYAHIMAAFVLVSAENKQHAIHKKGSSSAKEMHIAENWTLWRHHLW